MARAVREALGVVAAPNVRDMILRLAERWNDGEPIPERGPRVRSYVEGPLYRATEELLGEPSARQVREELMPIVAMVADDEISSVRITFSTQSLTEPEAREVPLEPVAGVFVPRPEPGPAADDDEFPELTLEVVELEHLEAPPANPMAPGLDGYRAESREAVTDPAPLGELPVVLVASCDPTGVQALSMALSGAATLEAVTDSLVLLEQAARSHVVVIDLGAPSVGLETLVALEPELPGHLRVVLWGDEARTHRRLTLTGQRLPAHWVCPGAAVREVVRICRLLLA